MTTYLVTGAGTGIGLQLAKRWLAGGANEVIAVVRPNGQYPELDALAAAAGGKLAIEQADVTRDADVARLAGRVRGRRIDVLVNNAGAWFKPDRPLAGLTSGDLARVFDVNVIGPVRICQALLPCLEGARRPVIAQISSLLGSIGACNSAELYGYRMSKAALNMFSKLLSVELKARGIICVTLHPGWVKTKVGGPITKVTNHPITNHEPPRTART
jgi:NAD(P)-dependent dehydrogenase (short-subunit alcohol dehydrogenase family)